ncbi:MAG: error-prone DNA polymerase [Alphaproteobacteria bacterium]|nr:error-prone DNA polymerase [Alphaproteobacteria bacterium]MCW5739016.1 error-prone DNA polymerase [Alphaproteobacteria bacterium]
MLGPFRYAELQVTSNYSFLRGGSHPHELVGQAADLGLAAIGITDRCTLAGVVQAHVAARKVNNLGGSIKLLIGSRIDTRDGLSLLLYPTDLPAYSRLTRLLTLGNSRAPKGQCHLLRDDLAQYAEGLIAIALPPRDVDDPGFPHRLRFLSDTYRRCYLAASVSARGDDAQRLAAIEMLARQHRTPMVATNDVHYHAPDRRALQDVVTAIRLGRTVDSLGFHRFANAERHLKSPDEMARLFRKYPAALAHTVEIADACTFDLDQPKYVYPAECDDGETPQEKLERLTWQGADWRYPDGVPDPVRDQLHKEFDLIRQREYASYFLTVYDIVQYARANGILCQGRGSAANSSVCYCLGITSVAPDKIKLLFARFLSSNRNEPPDIDVDFEHERREEVIQWIYEKYGRARAGLAATVIAYRSRSAIRDVGKALGLSSDTLGILADTVWGMGVGGIDEKHVREAGLDLEDRRLALALRLSSTLIDFPRHLSQHVGGFVFTADRLDDLVPIQNATMEKRTVVEWNKDDLDSLRILKVDVLALGMLTCIRKGLDLLRERYGISHDLASIPPEEPAVYEMLGRADSLGVFQVESRAQMSMLPRLRPKKFYDLVIEVAIVRPGPIQGDMVHPYLRRRDGIEKIEYPSPELKKALERTLGVPLFQEQAMDIAIVAAGFSEAEADGLRKAMATFRHNGTIGNYRERFIGGMVGNGYERAFAERCFSQIEGFGEYGFPESHAASFALLVYASSWIKCYFPDVFACALLNSQPMGFYAPGQIVRDAREHGITVLPPDINVSDWDNTLEPVLLTDALRKDERRLGTGTPLPALYALRLGFRQIEGASEKEMKSLVERRGAGYRDVADLWRRGEVSRAQIEVLARADAFGSLAMSRRDVLWAAKSLRDDRLPLLDGVATADREPKVALPTAALGEQVVDDYVSLRMSLRKHPLALLRPRLDADRVTLASQLATAPLDRTLGVCGLVLVRQRPGTASGVVFATLEDETGIANIVIWPKVFEKHRRVVMTSRLLLVKGRLQREKEVIHLVADRLEDLSGWLDGLADIDETIDATPRDKRSQRAPSPPRNRFHHPRDLVVWTRADAVRHGEPEPRDVERAREAEAARPHGAVRRIGARSRDFH